MNSPWGGVCGLMNLTRLFLRALFLVWAFTALPAFAASCNQATAQGTAPASWQTYCWLDMSSYNDTTARSTTGQSFSYTLSDGATLTFKLKVTNIAPAGATTPYLKSITAPSWSGAAVGNTAFLGIPGSPILYTVAAGTKTITISSIAIAPPPGSPAVTAYAFVAADAESTDTGESVQFVTNGGAWVQLDQVDPISGSNYPTITGIGTTTVNMAGAGLPSPTGGYIIGSTSPTTVTTQLVAGGLQGVMFAVRFASLRLNKTITGARINAADQFRFDITATGTGTVLATGTSTGAGNGPFTAAAVSLASGIPLTISETMATGSVSPLIKYRSLLNCVNGAAGSTTPVPSNLTLTPASGTASYSFGTLQFGDAIQCSFNNAAFPHISVQKALSGTRLFDTDQFVMSIKDGVTVIATTTTTGTGSTLANGATGLSQVTAGTSYAVDEAPSGSTALVQYNAVMSCTNAATGSTTILPTTAGGAITPQLGDIITCTITNTKKAANATLTVAKFSTIVSDPINGTVNPKFIPGAVVQYAILVTNTGTLSVDASTIFIRDPLPATVTYNGAVAVAFVNGTPASGLTWNAATDFRFSNAVTVPTSFAACTYTPSAGFDANVKFVCIRPSGTMTGFTASGQPNFTVIFQTRVN
jgi:uncharacterized repeat protein (TIGR01451 family)